MISICTPAALCEYHRDGGPATDKCYGQCDADDCTEEATVDVGDDCFCRMDAARILAAS
jgi:hypothetical protein